MIVYYVIFSIYSDLKFCFLLLIDLKKKNDNYVWKWSVSIFIIIVLLWRLIPHAHTNTHNGTKIVLTLSE